MRARRALPAAARSLAAGLALAAGLVLAGSSLALAGAGPALASPAAAGPARLLVTANEFSLVLSRQSLVAGSAVIQLVNSGEDDHNLKLRRVGGTRTRTIPTVGPGGLGELEGVLAPGRYRLWCSLGDHRARGMRATLLVRERARSTRRAG